MAIRYSFEKLMYILRTRSPDQVRRIYTNRRYVQNGLLSVGIKIHSTNSGTHFDQIFKTLGGANRVIEINYFRKTKAEFCWVLPPVGSADTAIALLKAIGVEVELDLFGNKDIQIQVCSPGRLTAENAALLSVGFYLGSDTIRKYSLDDLETTFSENSDIPKGRRITLYDAYDRFGYFDREFEWWTRMFGAREIQQSLPFDGDRTDILTAQSIRDIKNINLIATLLVHQQHNGYWKDLGIQFRLDMIAMLKTHNLIGILHAPWIRTNNVTSADDSAFMAVFSELQSYALDEGARLRKIAKCVHDVISDIPTASILEDMQFLLNYYHAEIGILTNDLEDPYNDETAPTWRRSN